MDWSTVSAWAHNPWVTTFALGVVSGAAVDIHAFFTSATWHVDGFDWGLATKRWFTGGLSAVVTKAGFGAVVG